MAVESAAGLGHTRDTRDMAGHRQTFAGPRRAIYFLLYRWARGNFTKIRCVSPGHMRHLWGATQADSELPVPAT